MAGQVQTLSNQLAAKTNASAEDWVAYTRGEGGGSDGSSTKALSLRRLDFAISDLRHFNTGKSKRKVEHDLAASVPVSYDLRLYY